MFSSPKRPDWSWGPPVGTGVLTLLGRQVNHSVPSSVQVKNDWSCASTPALHIHDVERDLFLVFLNFYLLLFLFHLSFFISALAPYPCGPRQLSRYSDSLRAGRSGDRIPVGARFSAPVQTGPRAHPSSYTVGTGCFPGVKRPGRGADHTYLAPRLKKK